MRLSNFLSVLQSRGYDADELTIAYAINTLCGLKHPLFAGSPLEDRLRRPSDVVWPDLETTFDQADTLTAATGCDQAKIKAWHELEYDDFLTETHTDTEWVEWQQEVLYQVATHYPAPGPAHIEAPDATTTTPAVPDTEDAAPLAHAPDHAISDETVALLQSVLGGVVLACSVLDIIASSNEGTPQMKDLCQMLQVIANDLTDVVDLAKL